MDKIEKKKYYQVLLELSLLNDKYIFGLINISQIPYKKLEDIFKDRFTRERFIFDEAIEYTIDKDLYAMHKNFFDKEIPIRFDFELFDYSVGLVVLDSDKYEKDYYEDLPPLFEPSVS